MFDAHLFTVHGALCLVAIAFAFGVRPGRGEAVSLAIILLGNFVFCALAYTPYAPKYALAALGIPVSSKDLWMVADALYGVAALFAFCRWWGWALWALAAVQVGVHMAYQRDMFDADTYSDRLQLLLHAQLAVFYLAGGPGALAFLRRGVDRLRRGCMGRASGVFTSQSRAE